MSKPASLALPDSPEPQKTDWPALMRESELKRTLLEILDSMMVLFVKIEQGVALEKEDIAHTKQLIGQLGFCHRSPQNAGRRLSGSSRGEE